jgi:hypothetical protein
MNALVGSDWLEVKLPSRKPPSNNSSNPGGNRLFSILELESWIQYIPPG